MAVLVLDGLRRDEAVSALRTENAMLHIQIAQMQADWTRLQEHNRHLQNLYAQQFRNSRKVADELCECRQQVLSLRRDIVSLRRLVQSVPEDLLREARMHTGNLVSVSTSQVQQTMQQQMVEKRAVEERVTCMQRELQALTQKYEVERARRKNLHNALVELRGNIRVHCRIRPVLSFDGPHRVASGPDEEVIAADDEETVSVVQRRPTVSGPQLSTKLFEFDHVFGPHESQGAVFDEVKPLLTSLLDGYNVCIVAYGQTGSGKTHTMLGSDGGSDPACQDGVIPMAAGHLYRLMEEREAEFDASYQVEVTVAEIYMEKIRDLLHHQQQGELWHSVSLGPEGEYDVTTLSSSTAHCPGDIVHLVQVGMQRRAEGATDIHQHSSRSHLIVTLTVTGTLTAASSVPSSISSTPQGSPPGSPLPSRHSAAVIGPSTSTPTKPSASRIPRPTDHASFGGKVRLLSSAPSLFQPSAVVSSTDSHNQLQLQARQRQRQPQAFRAKLQLVDLAGSECVGMSGATGNTLRETQCINKSLSALSDVLSALSHHKSHIPYRNSTLTHLLQSSIGGDSKLMILLCVSPAQRYLNESQRCLQFGSRARQIQRGAAKVKTITRQH